MAIVNVNTPIAGVGAEFQRWDGDSWEAIAEITNIGGPSASREMIDVTALNSTDGYRKFISSFRDSGAVNLSMNFTYAGYDLMKDDFELSTPQDYQICLKDGDDGAVVDILLVLGTSVVFEGLVQELPLTIPTDAQVTVDVVIKVTGAFTVYNVPKTTTPN